MKFCVLCNLHFGVSGGFFQGAKLRTLVYFIFYTSLALDNKIVFYIFFLVNLLDEYYKKFAKKTLYYIYIGQDLPIFRYNEKN
mgnify:CR=1 FL=1